MSEMRRVWRLIQSDSSSETYIALGTVAMYLGVMYLRHRGQRSNEASR
jgi:hypothetical protein